MYNNNNDNYNKWFPFFNIMMAKEKLKKKGAADPPELLMGLLTPNIPVIHQFLMTNTATDKAIATKQRNDAILEAAAAIQEKSELDEKIIKVTEQSKIVKGHNDRREQKELDTSIADLILMVES